VHSMVRKMGEDLPIDSLCVTQHAGCMHAYGCREREREQNAQFPVVRARHQHVRAYVHTCVGVRRIDKAGLTDVGPGSDYFTQCHRTF
jgi:hypothetical protein